jgi:hypothetical protein
VKAKFRLAVVLPALLVALAGCGGANGNDIPTDRDQERARELAQCMRDHGVEVPDPESGPDSPVTVGPGRNGAADEKTKAALEACREFMPNGGELTTPDPQQLEQARAYAQCMRDHGVGTFPDPQPDGGIQLGDAGVDPDDPTFRSADEACRDLRPAPGGGPGR